MRRGRAELDPHRALVSALVEDFVRAASGMHEAPTAGSDSSGHTALGGTAVVISSRIEIIHRG